MRSSPLVRFNKDSHRYSSERIKATCKTYRRRMKILMILMMMMTGVLIRKNPILWLQLWVKEHQTQWSDSKSIRPVPWLQANLDSEASMVSANTSQWMISIILVMMTLQICSIWLVVLQTIKASIRVLRCLLETRINKINQNSSKRLLLTMKMMVSASSKRQLKSQNRMKIAEIELLKKLLQATSSSISSLIIWTVSKFRSATLIIAVVWLGDRSAIYLHRRALALNNYSLKARRGVSTHPGPKASSLIKRCIMRSSKKKADPVVYWRQFKPSS